MISCFVTLSIRSVIPSWLSVLVISRDVIILLGIAVLTMMKIPFEVKPMFVSKVNTFLQILTITVALLYKSKLMAVDVFVLKGFFWVTALFTILSGILYIFRGVRYINSANGTDAAKSVNSA